MARLGWYLFVFAAGSAVLSLFGREFVILAWIDTWGQTTGWLIRLAMVVVGLLVMGVARASQAEQVLPGADQAV